MKNCTYTHIYIYMRSYLYFQGLARLLFLIFNNVLIINTSHFNPCPSQCLNFDLTMQCMCMITLNSVLYLINNKHTATKWRVLYFINNKHIADKYYVLYLINKQHIAAKWYVLYFIDNKHIAAFYKIK